MTERKPTRPKFLENVADENGVAIVVLDRSGQEVSASNNNSICKVLWDSVEFRPKCDQFCGRAFDVSREAEAEHDFECHAGLVCKAVAVVDRGRDFVAIVGRVFLKSEHYRNATEKAVSGEWSRFKPTEFFENILMSGSTSGIEGAAERLDRFTIRHENDILEVGEVQAKETPTTFPDAEISRKIEEFNRSTSLAVPVVTAPAVRMANATAEAARWRSLFGSIMKSDYLGACRAIVDFLKDVYSFDSVIWLDRKNDALTAVISEGNLGLKSIRVRVPIGSRRLIESAANEESLPLRERRSGDTGPSVRGLSLFPVTVGTEIRSAFAVEGAQISRELCKELFRFAKAIGPQIEILRLRDEVSRRDWVSQGVKRFSDSLKRIE